MKNKLGLILLVLGAVFTTRIFAQDVINNSTAKETDKTKYATIYIYRPRNYVGSIINYNIHLNDTVVCRIKNNTKYAIKVFKEGPSDLWAETEQKRKVHLDIKFGQSYYLKCGVTMGLFAGRPDLTLIYPEQGKLDYNNLDARNTKKDKNVNIQ